MARRGWSSFEAATARGGTRGVALRANLPEAWRGGAGAPPPAAVPESNRVASVDRLGRLEAALWLAGEPLSLRRLARVAGLAGVPEARDLVGELRERMARRRGGLDVVEVAGGVRLMTRPALQPWLEKIAAPADSGPVAEGPRLSPAGMEVLAIVAHRQPVVRAEVEAIRGVACGDLLRQLLEADLLLIVGRSGELGKPLLYGTTERFLELFGLRKLDELAPVSEGVAGAEPTKQNEPARRAAA